MKHLTKDKGDVAVAQVIAKMMKEGIQVCLPISEHLPFDLIALNCTTGELAKVQVKYVSLRDGKIIIPLEGTAWTNSRGMYAKKRDLSQIDAFAVYCPDIDGVYYVPVSSLKSSTRAFTLRVSSTRNSQKFGVNNIADFSDPMSVFYSCQIEGDSSLARQ